MKSVKINEIIAELKECMMDYCDWICWLCDKGVEGWDCNLLQIKLLDYIRFYQSDNEEDMDMVITNTETIYKNGLAGIDIYDEENFVGATASKNGNDILLKVLDSNKKVQAFVISVA